jgi:hypothetical protein
MRALLIIGVLLLLVGIASFFVPISYRERHGINAGPVSVGVTTTERRTAPPAVSASLIIAGAVLIAVGARKGAR